MERCGHHVGCDGKLWTCVHCSSHAAKPVRLRLKLEQSVMLIAWNETHLCNVTQLWNVPQAPVEVLDADQVRGQYSLSSVSPVDKSCARFVVSLTLLLPEPNCSFVIASTNF